MSLFKVNRGNEVNLPNELTDGWVYFCTDTGSFFIDHYDSTNALIRSKINAEHADKLRYIQGEEPADAPEGTLWIDMDVDGVVEGGFTYGSNYVQYTEQYLTEDQKAQARFNIGAATVNDVLAALPTWEGGSY